MNRLPKIRKLERQLEIKDTPRVIVVPLLEDKYSDKPAPFNPYFGGSLDIDTIYRLNL